MIRKFGIFGLTVVIILLMSTLFGITVAQEFEEFEVTGVTVYRVFPFKPVDVYKIKRIFFKNYSYADFSIDIPWSSPFSFNNTQRKMILQNIENNTFVSHETINTYFRDNESKNEYISFIFEERSSYRCVIFPTMVIGLGDLTETNEYISVSEMSRRRDNFLSFFEYFITQKTNLKFYFQQMEFLSDEPLPRESIVWTRIIRTNPNFNYLSENQLMDFLNFRTFNYEKVVTDNYDKMMLSSSIWDDYINEVVLFDGFKLSSWKTFYKYPLGLNENIIRLQMLTELNYVLLPYALNEVYELQEDIDDFENKLVQLNGKTPDEIKKSGAYEKLTFYKTIFRELQHLDIKMKLRNTDSIFETIFGPQIDYQYEKSSVYLEDIFTQYYFLKDYYNSLLNSAYIDSTLHIQYLYIFVAIIVMIGTITGPQIIDFLRYNCSTPNFSVYFKPTIGKNFEEKKVQEIQLFPDKEQLVWVILHNDGKVIKDNWYCIIDFEKDFVITPIENTNFKDVDFVKHYTIQKKYNAAHFNSIDISPLFPHNETFLFPIAVKTPKKSGNYNVQITVFTGNHKNKFTYNLAVIVSEILNKEEVIEQFTSLSGIGKKG